MPSIAIKTPTSAEEARQQLEMMLRLMQPESIPLASPFVALLETRLGEVASPEATISGLLSGSYLTALHGALLHEGRVDVGRLRAELNELLDGVEGLLLAHTATVPEGQSLLLPPSAGEMS